MKKILMLLFSVFLCSCSNRIYNYDFDYSDSYISNNNYTIDLTFAADMGRNPKNAYTLSIKNKTKQPLEIDWNKTLFIYNGITNGGFMFEGVVYSKRNDSKAPTIVLAGQYYVDNIYPNILAGYRRVGQYGGFWENNTIPDGKTGIFLTMRVNGKEVNETLIINKTTKIIEE